MPDVREFQPVVESAEKAAAAGDFTAAEQLLREAADLQEASLGPLHPDLASTFNNLAVACEMAGKLADAEQFYRRAYAIAASALGPQHPLVATSRDNLRDFCQARGLPLEEFPEAAPAAPPAPLAAVPESGAPVPAPVPPAPALRPAAPPAMAPPPPGAAATRRFATALAIVALLATLAVARLWLSDDGDTSGPPAAAAMADAAPEPDRAAPGPVPADANLPSAPPASRPLETPAQVASVPPRPATAAVDSPTARVPTPAASAPPAVAPIPAVTPSAPGDLRVVTASVCRTLATGQGSWRCDAASATNEPGRFSYYTRIASPRSVRVRHRWFQGDRLRQDVVLTVGANAVEGYRTFSRQTVSPGEWRVEVHAVNGEVLGETRFVVR